MDHSIFDVPVGAVDRLEFNNTVVLELWRDGELIAREVVENDVTNAGKNYLLDAGFNGGATTNLWYIGMIDNTGYTTVSAGDTPASHAGWAEFTGTGATGRLAWGQGASAGQQIVNGSVITTTISANGTLQGIFVISDGTKGGTVGTLWATALFSAPLVCSVGDTLNLTYAVQL